MHSHRVPLQIQFSLQSLLEVMSLKEEPSKALKGLSFTGEAVHCKASCSVSSQDRGHHHFIQRKSPG